MKIYLVLNTQEESFHTKYSSALVEAHYGQALLSFAEELKGKKPVLLSQKVNNLFKERK